MPLRQFERLQKTILRQRKIRIRRARHGIAVAAVLSSQFAALSGIAAYFLFRERLSRIQLAGVLTVIAGVAVLSALRA